MQLAKLYSLFLEFLLHFRLITGIKNEKRSKNQRITSHLSTLRKESNHLYLTLLKYFLREFQNTVLLNTM